MSDGQTIDMSNPPLVEALLGLNFHLSHGFTGFLLGSFWPVVRDIFPTPQLRTTATRAPSVRLLSTQGDLSLQLLENGIFVSWLRSPEGAEYPEFPTLFERFQEIYQRFVRFLDEHRVPHPTIAGLNMGYTNLIREPEGPGLDFVSQVFPDLAWRQRETRLSPPNSVDTQFSFEFPAQNGLLTAKISGPFPPQEPGQPRLLQFILEARGSVGQDTSQEEIWRWFVEAKQHLNSAFLDLTSQEYRMAQWDERTK